jgi:hypothetical protein
MEIVQKAKEYQLQTIDKKWVRIIFYHKDSSGNFVDGLTTEEVLGMLIDRQANFVKSTINDDDNMNALTHMKQALMFLNHRSDRKLEFKKTKNKQNA